MLKFITNLMNEISAKKEEKQEEAIHKRAKEIANKRKEQKDELTIKRKEIALKVFNRILDDFERFPETTRLVYVIGDNYFELDGLRNDRIQVEIEVDEILLRVLKDVIENCYNTTAYIDTRVDDRQKVLEVRMLI